MKHVAYSGKRGIASYLIINEDDEYSATVTTPTNKFETTCSSWQGIQNWVDRTITKIEEDTYEIGKYF